MAIKIKREPLFGHLSEILLLDFSLAGGIIGLERLPDAGVMLHHAILELHYDVIDGHDARGIPRVLVSRLLPTGKNDHR